MGMKWEKSTVLHTVPKDITVIIHTKIYFTEKGIKYSTLTTKGATKRRNNRGSDVMTLSG
jgi:hypothetical protein